MNDKRRAAYIGCASGVFLQSVLAKLSCFKSCSFHWHKNSKLCFGCTFFVLVSIKPKEEDTHHRNKLLKPSKMIACPCSGSGFFLQCVVTSNQTHFPVHDAVTIGTDEVPVNDGRDVVANNSTESTVAALSTAQQLEGAGFSSHNTNGTWVEVTLSDTLVTQSKTVLLSHRFTTWKVSHFHALNRGKMFFFQF